MLFAGSRPAGGTGGAVRRMQEEGDAGVRGHDPAEKRGDRGSDGESAALSLSLIHI